MYFHTQIILISFVNFIFRWCTYIITHFHRITQMSLECRMQLEPFEYYLACRRLRWAGHVSRMPISRLPHMFLSSWVDDKRPKQRPQFKYGHGLLKDISNAEAWDTLAGDRNLWHTITQQKNVYCNTAGGGYAWLDSEQLDQDTATSAFAFFLRRCPSGTSLHFYAVNSVSRQPEIARTNQIAHQTPLIPLSANPAAPNTSSFTPFSVAADTMQPSLSQKGKADRRSQSV
jgi:hypothetical protein